MIKGHVLIVDDEPSNLMLMEELFHQQGARASAAPDGSTALAQQERPDIVILDVMMPGMNGYEVCRRLKADEATRRIPVVMVTGLGALDDKIRGLEADADNFPSKPVNAAELLTRSRSLLKVKELGDELESACHRLAEIASYNNSMLRQFDPYNFDLDYSLRGLMEFLLAPTSSDKTRLQRVLLLGADQGDDWSGWDYFLDQGRLAFRYLPSRLSAPQLAPVFEVRGLVYANRGDETFAAVAGLTLWSRLREPPPQQNLVAYRSDSVAVLALDFGKQVSAYEAQVLSALVATIHFFLKTISSHTQEVERAFLYTIGDLARAAESHDEDTGNHTIRVNRYAESVATALSCEPNFVKVLGCSAQMHGVGKLHIHPDILRKPSRLTTREWNDVKKRTIYGVRILGEGPRGRLVPPRALGRLRLSPGAQGCRDTAHRAASPCWPTPMAPCAAYAPTSRPSATSGRWRSSCRATTVSSRSISTPASWRSSDTCTARWRRSSPSTRANRTRPAPGRSCP